MSEFRFGPWTIEEERIPEVIEMAARAAHETNRSWQRIHGELENKSWEEETEEMRASLRKGARAIWDNPGLTPEDSHKGWCETKVAEGWVYGRTKDFTAKTHPCLVPYNELAYANRVKDTLFGTTIRLFFTAYCGGFCTDESMTRTNTSSDDVDAMRAVEENEAEALYETLGRNGVIPTPEGKQWIDEDPKLKDRIRSVVRDFFSDMS
jgi:hypothetical protein